MFGEQFNIQTLHIIHSKHPLNFQFLQEDAPQKILVVDDIIVLKQKNEKLSHFHFTKHVQYIYSASKSLLHV